ncbi:MAG: hypothetical protein J1E61_09775 [Lachnospiraceae bacterium]|nr:hypothetical protein [Lachnospiraceae bacterium]
MLWFYKLEQKYGKYAIPNLTLYLIICYAIGYTLQFITATIDINTYSGIFSFINLDVYQILHGQIWRLFSWLLIPPGSIDILTLVVLYCYYSIGTLLERTWGTFKYNVFMFSGMIFTVLGAIILYMILYAVAIAGGGSEGELMVLSGYAALYFSTYYVSMSIFLAFAMTFPEARMMFMFVIPIKAKVLGIIYVILMAYQILTSFRSGVLFGVLTTIVIGFSLLNVLIFFIVTRKNFRTPSQIKRQKEFQRKQQGDYGRHVVKMKKVTRHKCAICGRTEETDPDEEFRFCSKCEGNYEYCSKHIYTHSHIKKENQ